MAGRQIFVIAKKGKGFHCKALAFASRKYDISAIQCKESGMIKEDIIQYARLQMYKLSLKRKKETDKDPNCEDCPDEQEN